MRSKYAERGPVIQARVSQKAYRKGPRYLTQRASFASPHAERDVLSGVTRDGEVSAFISGPAALCRRCASDASQESVGNAGSIDVTTNR